MKKFEQLCDGRMPVNISSTPSCRLWKMMLIEMTSDGRRCNEQGARVLGSCNMPGTACQFQRASNCVPIAGTQKLARSCWHAETGTQLARRNWHGVPGTLKLARNCWHAVLYQELRASFSMPGTPCQFLRARNCAPVSACQQLSCFCVVHVCVSCVFCVFSCVFLCVSCAFSVCFSCVFCVFSFVFLCVFMCVFCVFLCVCMLACSRIRRYFILKIKILKQD